MRLHCPQWRIAVVGRSSLLTAACKELFVLGLCRPWLMIAAAGVRNGLEPPKILTVLSLYFSWLRIAADIVYDCRQPPKI